ncbi:MAG: hypothetical protein OQK82_00325 [Candidatus Pacearchaeota archaeon]|nr:hypothetical protein [Candidatus Pacearchaeota archaeon]
MDISSKEILVSITGRSIEELKAKITECEKLNLSRVSVFLTFLGPKEKFEIYELLLSSSIKNIPLVHLRHDMSEEEINFFVQNFNTKCFTIHENHFSILHKWKKFSDKLFLEFNYDNKVPKSVHIEKIGGFCIDLSHFMASLERQTKDDLYIINHRKSLFLGNHLNGYDFKKKQDKHFVESINDFNYLKILPRFIFGKYIALEMFNSISEQLKFKKYLEKVLKEI